jgi:uncharacterized protein (DUF983 family)
MTPPDNKVQPTSLLQAFVGCKCPQCRKGSIFTKPAFSTQFMETNAHCPVCHLRFEREPGFFWGSMYISFGLTVGIFLAVLIAKSLFFNSIEWYIQYAITIGLLVVLSPMMFRTSRVIMLYAFGGVRYNPNLPTLLKGPTAPKHTPPVLSPN